VRLVDQPTFNALRAGTVPLGAGQFLATTPFGVGDFPFTSESEFRRPAFKYQADLDWGDRQALSAGYEYERESDPLHPAFLVENHAYFVQQQFRAEDRWFATIGARLDDNTRYGRNVSPKLSVGGFPLPYQSGSISSIKVFSNIGRGIKNPLFGELYSTAFSDGNPDLRPERARTVDAGAELTFDNQRFLGRVTYFDNAFNDQVAFKSTGPGLDGKPDFINIDGSKASGWEIEGALQKPIAGGLTAQGGYAFVDTRVVAFVSTSEQFQPGQPLLRRPKHAATLRIAYARGRGGVNLNVRYVGQRHDAAFLGLSAVGSAQFPNGRSVDITVNPAYTLLWLGGDVRLSREATVYLRIDNLTDTTYESALGFPGLPRSVVAGVRVNIGKR
jgi:vitamin B12 transporter